MIAKALFLAAIAAAVCAGYGAGKFATAARAGCFTVPAKASPVDRVVPPVRA